ncbi:unannotated protein [freshwater metagenome]|uniref:Unannotated protein n=1 Tax=freshwater metagenome TaxID=449393 RepID=A0A6J6SR39_9ZZZZ
MVGLSALIAAACAAANPVLEQIDAWSPAIAPVSESQVRAALGPPTGRVPIVPLADPNLRVVGSLRAPNLLFAQIVAQPSAGGLGPHECMLVFAGDRLEDDFCQVDAEFLIHVSSTGFLAAPVYDAGVTEVRLTVCGHRRWEQPLAGFVVFPLDAQEIGSVFALEVFRGSKRISVEGTKAALGAKGCVATP